MALRLSGLPVDSFLPVPDTGDAAIRHFLCPRFTYPLGIHRQRLFPNTPASQVSTNKAVHTDLCNVLFLFRQRARRHADDRQSASPLTDTLRQAIAVHVRYVHTAQEMNIDSIFTQHIQSVHAIIIGCLTLIPQRSH